MVWMIQTLCGSPLTVYATYFYNEAGLSAENSFDLCLRMYGTGVIGAMISWFLLLVVGRRTLYLWGTGLCFIILVVAGSVGTRKTPLELEAQLCGFHGPWALWSVENMQGVKSR